MKESLGHIDSRIVFRETFQSEQNTRLKTSDIGSVIIWSKGEIIGDGSVNSFIDYPVNLNGVYSVRMKINSSNFTNIQYLFNCAQASGVGWTRLEATTGVLTPSSGTAYVDGLAGTTIILNTEHEIIIAGISLTTVSIFTVLNHYNHLTQGLVGDCDLVEIYKGTLTAEEVKNLRENKTYHELPIKTSTLEKILDVTAIQGVLENKFSGDYIQDYLSSLDFTDGWSGTGTIVSSTQFTTSSGGQYIRKLLPSFDGGKKYKFHIIGSVSIGNLSITDYQISTVYKTVDGEFNEVFYLDRVVDSSLGFSTSAASVVDITHLKIEEIVPELELTDVETKKVGSNVWSPDFNGSSSKIDCGNYDDLTGDKTYLGWFNLKSRGESNSGRLIDNGKFYIRQNANPALYYTVSSNGGVTTANSNVITEYGLNEFVFMAVTITSTGICNFYIGTLNNAPVLSGLANQDSGTPVAGTTNIILGNNNAGSATFDGLKPQDSVFKGIASLQQITQEWSNTRRLYE